MCLELPGINPGFPEFLSVLLWPLDLPSDCEAPLGESLPLVPKATSGVSKRTSSELRLRMSRL